MPPSAPLVAFVAIACMCGFWSLRSLEHRVLDALETQHKFNVEVMASMSKAGIKTLDKEDALEQLRNLGAAKIKALEAANATAQHSKVVRAQGKAAGGAAGPKARAVVSEAETAEPDGNLRDRDGRVVIAPSEKQDTDDESDGADEFRLTPAPPPPRPSLPKLPKGRDWQEGDANFGFEADESLPSIGVITLNGQAGASGGIGFAHKSSWMHRMSYTNKHAYCKRWGYDLIIEDNSIIDQTRDVAWSKIPIFKKWLPKYQWLMWVDMDAFFMRFDLPIADLIDNDHDLIIAKDWHGINFGVFLIRNSPWAYQLLDKMWNSPQSWWRPWEEQSALMALTNPKRNPVEAEGLLEHIRFPRQRDINAYGAEFAYGNLQALYRTGDRIVHFPNCKGIRTCRGTIEQFYKSMLADNGVEDMDPQDVPAAQFPDTS
jgi:hypothetical protein